MKLSKIAARNITRNKRRSALSAVAITIAVAGIVFLFSFLEGMIDDMTYNLQTYSVGAVRVRNSEFNNYEVYNPTHLVVHDAKEIYKVVEETEGVELISPRINFAAPLYQKDSSRFISAIGTGIDFERERLYQNLDDYLVDGAFPQPNTPEALVSVKLAERLNLSIGDKITVMGTTARRTPKGFDLKITGLVHFAYAGMNDGTILAPIETMQRLLLMNNAVSEILIKVGEKEKPEQVALRVEEALQANNFTQLDSEAWTSIETSYSFVEMAKASYLVIALIIFILASSVIINTTMMVIFERMREIGMLSAIGMEGKSLVKLFFVEAVFISSLGAFAGLVIGIVITLILERTGLNFGDMMEGIDFDVSTIIYPKISPYSSLFVFAYSIVVSSLVTIVPSIKAARVEPVRALRYT